MSATETVTTPVEVSDAEKAAIKSTPAEAPTTAPLAESKVAEKPSSLAGANATKTKSKPAKATKKKVSSKPMDGFSNMLVLMDDHSYHPACFSIYAFREDLSRKVVTDFFHHLALAYPKYEQVVTRRNKAFKPAVWMNVHDTEVGGKKWTIDDNIEEVTLEENKEGRHGNGKEALFKVAGDFVARHFNYDKPVWEALLVHGLNGEDDGAKSALMIKIHHCFADGQGMIQSYHSALHAMNNDISTAQVQQEANAKEAKRPHKEDLKPTVGGTLRQSMHIVRRLFITGERKTFSYTEKRKNRVSGRLYAHSKGIAMDDIKLVRKAFTTQKYNITLNDVACAIATKAMRRQATKDNPKSLKERSVAFLIPISLRPKGNWELENYSTGSIAWFDFGKKEEMSMQEQIEQVHREMRMIKRSKFPNMTWSIFRSLFKAKAMYQPRWPLLDSFWEKSFQQYHLMTNVPGPAVPVRFGNTEAFAYHVLPPSSPGKASMAVGLISYAGYFSIAVTADKVLEFKDLPNGICQSFEEVAQEFVDEAKRRLAAEKKATSPARVENGNAPVENDKARVEYGEDKTSPSPVISNGDSKMLPSSSSYDSQAPAFSAAQSTETAAKPKSAAQIAAEEQRKKLQIIK